MAGLLTCRFYCKIPYKRGVTLAAPRQNHYFSRRHFPSTGAMNLKGTQQDPGPCAQKTHARKIGVSCAREARFRKPLSRVDETPTFQGVIFRRQAQ